VSDQSTFPSGEGSPRDRAWLAWLFIAFAWFASIGTHSLFDPDEGRYAEIPREMWASGDWITPTLNGLPYFEKPVLQYWATAAIYALTGVSEAGSRFWAFALAFGCMPLLFWLSRGLGFSTAIAWRAVFFLAISPFYVLIGHVNLLDQSFAFFAFAALATFLIAQRSEEDQAEKLMLLAWAALAAAVLTKGIVVLVLTGATLVVHAIVHRDAGFLKRLRFWPGGLLFLAIVAPWFWSVETRNPGFLQFFFIHEHFARFLTKVHRRDEPWWYFIPLVLLAALPVIGTWRRGLARSWREKPEGAAFPALRFLIFWCLVTFVFFSLSNSKLPPYILPMIPPLMLLLASQSEDDRKLSRHALILQSLLIGVLSVAMIIFDRRRDGAFDLPVFAACGVGLVALAFAWFSHLRGRSQHALWMPVALSALFAWQGLLVAYAVLPPERSARALVATIRSEVRPTTTLYSVAQYRHSASFYLGRSMTLVAYKGELEEGLRRVGAADPSRYIETLETFVVRWREERDAVAFIEPRAYDELRALGFEGRRLPDADPRSVVVARR